jgi:hypothetical protein
MGEPIQYSFELSEIAQLLLRSSGIHEGKWVIGIEFGIAVGPVGPKADEVYPGAVITVNKVMLSAATDGQQPPNLVFDAAVLNAKKTK